MRQLLVILIGSVLPQIAGATTLYECKFADGQGVPGVIIVSKDEKSGEATVYDGFIKHVFGKPIPARIGEGTSVRTSFVWTVKGEGQTSQNGSDLITYKFTLSYYTNGTPAKVTVSPLGYDNEWYGTGNCTVKKG